MKDIIRELTSGDVSITSDNIYRYFLNDSKGESTINFSVEENKSLKIVLIDLNKNSLKLTINASLKRGSKCEIYLASINTDHNEKVFSFNIDHNEGDTYSRCKMMGINASDNKLIFIGNSYIANKAHKSDTRQEGKITNLNPLAQSEVSPVLLIKDNDVKASHGAALGAYNEDQLFYLMSRGLSLQESKKLITFGSLLPIIEMLEDEDTINSVKNTLEGLKL